eukprot:scaffold6934_cov66-Phaeocystis_antarctica.AAC.2
MGTAADKATCSPPMHCVRSSYLLATYLPPAGHFSYSPTGLLTTYCSPLTTHYLHLLLRRPHLTSPTGTSRQRRRATRPEMGSTCTATLRWPLLLLTTDYLLLTPYSKVHRILLTTDYLL